MAVKEIKGKAKGSGKRCYCKMFDEGMEAVNSPIFLQSARSGGAYQFDQKYVFKYRPWCGNELNHGKSTDTQKS